MRSQGKKHHSRSQTSHYVWSQKQVKTRGSWDENAGKDTRPSHLYLIGWEGMQVFLYQSQSKVKQDQARGGRESPLRLILGVVTFIVYNYHSSMMK